MSSLYSEQVVTTVLNYISTRIQAKIDAQEIAMSLTPGTIPALKSFTWGKPNDNQTPYGVLYDYEGDDFNAMELHNDQEVYHFTIEFKQTGGDTATQRRHLLAYRDAVKNIIKDDSSFGTFESVRLRHVRPGLIFKEDNGYRGLISLDIDVEI